MSLDQRSIERMKKQPVFACDIDAVLVNPNQINSLWLPGNPKPHTIPVSEAEAAQRFGMDLNQFYRRKDEQLKKPEAIDIKPTNGAAEVLGLIAVEYTVVFVSARVNDVHDATKAWLENHFDIGEITLFTVGDDTHSLLDSKQAIYKGLGVEVMIDDKPQHHDEAKGAGVDVRLYYHDGSYSSPEIYGTPPEGSTVVTNFLDVRDEIFPSDFDSSESEVPVTVTGREL